MKSYPYIGKWKELDLTVLFVANCEGFEMGNIQNHRCDWSGGKYTNITPEYLANTYGEVVSPEHAEFIVKLGKNANAKIDTVWYKGDFFNFYQDSVGNLCLDFFSDTTARNGGEKQITIPLSPKQIQTATPEEEFEMTQIMKNAGDNLVLGCEDSKCEEWPQVGDEVLVYSKFRRLAEIKGKAVKVIGKCNHSDGSTIITVEHSSLGVFAAAEWSWIKKPKTPEEELRDELFNCKKPNLDTLQADDLSEWLIANYEMKKKPQ